MNLLIIDDDAICNFVNTRVAVACGIFKDIRSVNTGMEAMEIFEQISQGNATAPDLILLDLNMPVVNGFDLIQTLRSLKFPNEKKPAIVILTSSDDSVDIARARALGIEDYLLKSNSVKNLQAAIFSLYNKILAGTSAATN